MVIDFHTHAFPEAIAARSVEKLAAIAHMTPHHDGTAAGLRRRAREDGIDLSVVLPVVTAPRQVESVNRFAAEESRDGLFFFGGIHPDCEHPEEILDAIAAAGRKGVKFHPDYQGVRLGDERYIRITRGCAERGLCVVTHTGWDPLSPEDIHATVEDIERLLEGATKGGLSPTLVLAHLGGEKQLEQVEARLMGAPVYLDTANMLDRTPPETVVRLIRKHGADRVLFATDSPWGGGADFLTRFHALPLPEEEQEAILWRNAATLLGLSVL